MPPARGPCSQAGRSREEWPLIHVREPPFRALLHYHGASDVRIRLPPALGHLWDTLVIIR